MIGFFFVRIFHFDAAPYPCLGMELYPFIKFENRTDALGGVRFAIESPGAAGIAMQAQSSHNVLFSLFEIDEIEFAKYRCILNLLYVSIRAIPGADI